VDLRERARRYLYRHGAGFTEQECAIYRLADLPVSQERDFISFAEMRDVVRPALNDRAYAAMLDDKWVFDRYMKSFGVPAPRTYGLYHPVHGRDEHGAPLRTPPAVRALLAAVEARAIVVKPAGGRHGVGVRSFDVVRDRRGVRLRAGDTETTVEDVFAGLPPGGSGRASGHVIQERLDQHDRVAALAPFTLNTVRLCTLLRSDGRVALSRPVIRLGRNGAPADNWDRGGVAVTISDDGVLGEGIVKSGDGTSRLRQHPDTGRSFVGERLPHWSELLEVATYAATLLPHVRTIGWDLVITPTGAVVLEGNYGWEIVSAQLSGHGYLDAALRAELRELGLDDPTPRPTLRRAARRTVRRGAGRVRRRLRSGSGPRRLGDLSAARGDHS
jgi:hypothetical protein